MSRYIGTLPVPTADTKLVITKGKDSSNRPTYNIHLGGRYDWNSYIIGTIGKCDWAKSSIYGMATDRIDLWTIPSKVKTQVKTLADFCHLFNTHFYSDDNGTVFIGCAYHAKPIDRATDPYCFSTKTDGLTLIC